jgi:hypothetical protein
MTRTVWRAALPRILASALLPLSAMAIPADRLAAQGLGFLAADQVRAIENEISGSAAYEHIRFMTQFHRPRGGADGLWQVAEYAAARAREAGLSDVHVIRQSYQTRPWNARFADLRIGGVAGERIASTLQTPLHLADFSRPAAVTAELVDVGGGSPAELDALPVAGRIVLTHGALNAVMTAAVHERGALGVVWYPSPYTEGSGTDGSGFNRPDQVRWLSLSSGAADGREPTFAFVLSLRQGLALRNRLAAAREPLRVHAVVDAGFDSVLGEEPWQVMVEGWIRGTEHEAGQDIVLTSHTQEEKYSANDDASGVASMLEIARALNRLIDEGVLSRPRRSIRFWWVREFASQRQYFADHPDAHRRMWVNVNQDMVGADQSQDVLRKQNITRVPATRFHFLNDVTEAVVEYMVASNTFELAQAQAGIPLYPNPHLSGQGSRHRYNAEMIFFHGNTDHIPFLEAPIGVPAVSFTNMPDRFIHSTDDDLGNIDRTQLQRNAVAAALIAYAMANAGAASASALAAETAGRGAERMARNTRLGLSWIAAAGRPAASPFEPSFADVAAAYHAAADQVRYAGDRERRAVASLEQVRAGGALNTRALLDDVSRREAQALREVAAGYERVAGRRAPARSATPAERRLAQLRPQLAAGPRELHMLRGQIPGVAGLHNLMAFEILNAVDGRRSGEDIYRLVAAQAREAGPHYYGTVAPDAVVQYLENVARLGIVRL